jgi:hypothetical protein
LSFLSPGCFSYPLSPQQLLPLLQASMPGCCEREPRGIHTRNANRMSVELRVLVRREPFAPPAPSAAHGRCRRSNRGYPRAPNGLNPVG